MKAGPRVQRVSPEPGSLAYRYRLIEVEFDRSMKTVVPGGVVQIEPPVDFGLRWKDETVLQIILDQPLDAGQRYDLSLLGGGGWNVFSAEDGSRLAEDYRYTVEAFRDDLAVLKPGGAHAYLSSKQIALPVSATRGVPNQAIKVFGKANLLRSLSPGTCLRYALSQPGVSVAVCGCGTVRQMEDNIRAVQNFRKMTPGESAEVRKRAVVGAGVFTGPTLEYWKKKA